MPSVPPPSSNTVLVAEDDADLRGALVAVLRSAGWNAIGFGDGRGLLNRIHHDAGAESLPAAVVSDVDMPRVSGLDAAQQIRRLAPDLPILLLSGLAAAPDIASVAQQLGATIISKPCSAIALRRAVEQALLPGSAS